MTKKTIPRLLVFFDTNVLFTQVASDLVPPDVKTIVMENSDHVDLEISWILPNVVIEERKYQMLSKARDLLPNLQKLEKLIGHAFGVEDDTLNLHIDAAIQKTIEDLKIKVVDIDVDRVDWSDLIARSTTRRPPFQEGNKEKGLRDALIAQVFLQTLANSPSTTSVCRLAIVTADQKLKEYIAEKTAENKNVRVLSSLNEVENLINTLTSTISEEFAADLARKAANLFFIKGNEKTFYYKREVLKKIREESAGPLEFPNIPGHLRSDDTWRVLNPIFVRKSRQRVYWISIVELEFEIYHLVSPQDQSCGPIVFGGMCDGKDGAKLPYLGGGLFGSPFSQEFGKGLIGGTLLDNKVIDLKVRERVEVSWSAIITQSHSLTSPRLEGVKIIGYNPAG